MIIYTNHGSYEELEDDPNCKIKEEEFIYTSNGIYKKYKYHFYEMTIEKEVKTYNYDNKDYYIQSHPHEINKNILITSIPYHHYYVRRKTASVLIDDNIELVKETDNDVYTRHYFVCSGDIFGIVEKISCFLNKKV
tara:strand:+ start:87 stop:494 length:408 start_codon:yes stop_codon:yes gene_type:complete